MTEMVPIDTPQEFIERAIPLLKEYSKKVNGVKRQIREMRHEYSKEWNPENTSEKKPQESEYRTIYEAELDALEEYFKRLKPAILLFGQQVSGMIDQGKVSPLTNSRGLGGGGRSSCRRSTPRGSIYPTR